MSVFLAGEICASCPSATMHSCGMCLASCAVGLAHDRLKGTCTGYTGSDVVVLKRIARESRAPELGSTNQKSDHGQGD